MGDARFDNVDSNVGRAPLVFCIDASGSMTKDCDGGMKRIDLLNYMIRGCFEMLLYSSETRSRVMAAFVVFTDKVVLETEFERLDRVSEEMFRRGSIDATYYDRNTGKVLYTLDTLECQVKPEGYQYPIFSVSDRDDGTDIGGAVLHAVKKLENMKETLARNNEGSYAATLVLVTDGYAELEVVSAEKQEQRIRNQKAAIAAIKDHCYTNSEKNNLIIPFIIGVGENSADGVTVDDKILDDYAGDFIERAFHVRNKNAKLSFGVIGNMIGKSVKKSMTVNDLRALANDINDAAYDVNEGLVDEY